MYMINNWILTTDHKRIGIMYGMGTTIFGFIGFYFSTIIRLELFSAGDQILGGNIQYYMVLITIHGITMIFFLVMPILTGAFGNIIIPVQIGTSEMSFPKLNNFSASNPKTSKSSFSCAKAAVACISVSTNITPNDNSFFIIPHLNLIIASALLN